MIAPERERFALKPSTVFGKLIHTLHDSLNLFTKISKQTGQGRLEARK